MTQSEEEQQPKYLHVEDIAKELDVSVSAIRRLIYKGELPCVRVGKFIRIEVSAYQEWLEAQKKKSKR